MRYDEDDEEGDEEWGHNEELASVERYSEDARDQALLVKARVDDEVEVVLVFRVNTPRHHPASRQHCCNICNTTYLVHVSKWKNAAEGGSAGSVVLWVPCSSLDSVAYA